jgi:hypothetical protein
MRKRNIKEANPVSPFDSEARLLRRLREGATFLIFFDEGGMEFVASTGKASPFMRALLSAALHMEPMRAERERVAEKVERLGIYDELMRKVEQKMAKKEKEEGGTIH